jgi:hypothetical protein
LVGKLNVARSHSIDGSIAVIRADDGVLIAESLHAGKIFERVGNVEYLGGVGKHQQQTYQNDMIFHLID